MSHGVWIPGPQLKLSRCAQYKLCYHILFFSDEGRIAAAAAASSPVPLLPFWARVREFAYDDGNSTKKADAAGSFDGGLPMVVYPNSLPEAFESVEVPTGAKQGEGRCGLLSRKLSAFIGPGYMVAVGYMDPGNWATDIAGGAQFRYTLLFVVLLSSLLAMFLQVRR